MFNSLLIANRGEIARRIIKTAKKMGIITVAIYSDIDRDNLHVQEADEAYCIGEALAKSSYLNINAIITAAKKSGVDAIHPGYGFLSENPYFAQACLDAGITFIGPSISSIKAMASKQTAKQLLEQTAVPLTPGYHGSEQTDERLLIEAKRIGFPVLLKAANGGGGKGMRAVYKESEFFSALSSARREALASFADDTMIIEKLMLNPRHIEIQIMADNYGNVVHLFERDCSIQRRHQKIIEEAPAPHLNPTLRDHLTAAACEVARTIHYQGAGTVEFLVENNEHFYFMEMNTRLQVEHPVTEMITGFDLVAWQIKIAANQPLPCRQEDIKIQGHAIECRIYAEDPKQDFIPSIGQLNFLKEPEGCGIRIDTGVDGRSRISQYYDPMIAKLIAWGEDRPQALQRLNRALDQFAIGGIKSNISFLQAINKHPRFIAGDLTTHFLQEETLTFTKPNASLALFMVASFDYLKLVEKNSGDPLLANNFAWQMHLNSSWQWCYLLEEKQEKIYIESVDQCQFTATLHDKKITLHANFINDRLMINDGIKTHTAWIQESQGNFTVYLSAEPIFIQRFSFKQTQALSHNLDQLTAPMPATVVAILKKQGDIIKKGEQLLVLEAMKMEHTIHAPKDGILSELFYEVGAQVHEGAQLLTLKD